MFFDREKATKNLFNQIEISKSWIIIKGNQKIGKTAFVKNAIINTSCIYCEPEIELDYMKAFCKKLSAFAKDIIIGFSKERAFSFFDYKDIINQSTDFINDLNAENASDCIYRIIKHEINNHVSYLSKYIGLFLSNKITYIILDNFYKCDLPFYEWFISLSEVYISDKSHIITICDSDTIWKSDYLKTIFSNIITPININKFDDGEAYFQLINHYIFFNNDMYAKELADTLFKKYEGDSLKILKLIEIANSKIQPLSNDQDRVRILLEESKTIEQSVFNKINSLQKYILVSLAVCKIPVTADQIEKIIEHNSFGIQKECEELINKNLILCDYDFEKQKTTYRVSELFSLTEYISLVNQNYLIYIKKKVYALNKTSIIQIRDFDYLDLAITINSSDLYCIIKEQLQKLFYPRDNEIAARIIDKAITSSGKIFDYIKSFSNVKLLYSFGYYKNALNLIIELENDDSNIMNYELIMKKGDIQHLLLDPETSNTFKRASEINNISTSQKLSAINRQVMAMSQQSRKKLFEARDLYNATVTQYYNNKCLGLVELLRNANNFLPHETALKYTIYGYKISSELGYDIERIKCLHNICMLGLYNNSFQLLTSELHVAPSFELVLEEIKKLQTFIHETAYPLLDLGTIEMFKYNDNQNTKYLYSARTYYSQAQLYAKSFYAINIAKMGLLIVNSYLYKNIAPLHEIRKQYYTEYQLNKKDIKDFRVHRKILFSMATSCLITGDYEEGKKYLLESKQHVFESETLRYNNLCDALYLPDEKIITESIDYTRITEYHKTIKFVPWLISFGH